MNWLKAAKTGESIPSQTAKQQEDILKINNAKEQALLAIRGKAAQFKQEKVSEYANGCEYHGCTELPCYDCTMEDFDYDNDIDILEREYQ